MIGTLILTTVGVVYARQEYKKSPKLQAFVKKTNEFYQLVSKPVVQVVEYADGQGAVRSKESFFDSWKNWAISTQRTPVKQRQETRYDLETCRRLATALQDFYQRQAVKDQVINVETFR